MSLRTENAGRMPDVWDILVSDRSYRRSVSKDEAIAYIKDQAGKQFDPQVVQTFLAIIRD